MSQPFEVRGSLTIKKTDREQLATGGMALIDRAHAWFVDKAVESFDIPPTLGVNHTDDAIEFTYHAKGRLNAPQTSDLLEATI